ncbi:MAG TPA: hypothetical protein VGL86_12255 [Polyangia bacterium]|jgi:hypothetical protein
MNGRSSALVTITCGAFFWIGCFPAGSVTSDGGTTTGFVSPTLELTISGVHFGPAAPDPGAFVDLVTTRDGNGTATASAFRMSASVGSAGCTLSFDTFGGGTIGVGQYTVESEQGDETLDGTVYPTTAERVATPEGGAGCTGSDCDGSGFTISAADAAHISGFFSGTVVADSGAGTADVICTFWLTPTMYSP